MTNHSRRSFLKTASVTAGVVGAAAIAVPGLTSSAEADTVPRGPAHDGSFAAWVTDAKSGEIAVMVGDHTVVHTDKVLAAKLAQIAGRASKS